MYYYRKMAINSAITDIARAAEEIKKKLSVCLFSVLRSANTEATMGKFTLKPSNLSVIKKVVTLPFSSL